MASMDTASLQPITLYGSNISCFTGKLENYFRVKWVPYALHSMQLPHDFKLVREQVGVAQMPVLPQDPLQAFVCFLIEDYADEWLWRPAMHYRWHYPEGTHHQSRHLADKLMGGIRLPAALKRWNLRLRQRRGYTTGDGITRANVPGVEAIYQRTLQQLQAVFEQRPFILGDRHTQRFSSMPADCWSNTVAGNPCGAIGQADPTRMGRMTAGCRQARRATDFNE